MRFFEKLICVAILILSLIELIAVVGYFAVPDFAFGDKIGSFLRIFHILLCVTLTVVIKLRSKPEREPNIHVSATAGETERENAVFPSSPILWSVWVKTAAIVLLVLTEKLLMLGLLTEGSVPYRLAQSVSVICAGTEIMFALLCAVFASVAVYMISENKENEEENRVE